jgi:hypothetical protein
VWYCFSFSEGGAAVSSQQQGVTTKNWGSPQWVRAQDLESLLPCSIKSFFGGEPRIKQTAEGEVTLQGRIKPVSALITCISPGNYQIQVPRGFETVLSMSLSSPY